MWVFVRPKRVMVWRTTVEATAGGIERASYFADKGGRGYA
jgi:hypothetical protein